MIVRLWRGLVASGQAAEYTAYQKEVGPPGYRKIRGNLGIYVLGRAQESLFEIAMLTFWKSWQAIRAFAGEPLDKARYYERDLDYLVNPPEKVEHFQVIARLGAPRPATAASLWRGRSMPSCEPRIASPDAADAALRLGVIEDNRGAFQLCQDLGQRVKPLVLSLWNSAVPPEDTIAAACGTYLGPMTSGDQFDVLAIENLPAEAGAPFPDR